VISSKKEGGTKYDLSLYKRGDLLEVPRTLFTHFGIYLGDNRVAHLIPDILPLISKNKSAIAKMVTNNRLLLGVIAKVASVRVDSVEDFAYGSEILVNHMDKVCSQPPLDGDEVAQRGVHLFLCKGLHWPGVRVYRGSVEGVYNMATFVSALIDLKNIV
uniref:LRAT domain-containing protein n=1 Tax=Monopterus albus TaxID=43700 RepID=A0A3Q3Q156_MONAL